MMRVTLAFVVVVLLAPVVTVPAASMQLPEFTIVQYQRPVQARVVDPFRPPAHVGAPGNRGLEYGNRLWVGVYAAADGVVFFSGMVAGNGVVTIVHADGVKTTYSGMTDTWAVRGANVVQGEPIGQAGRNIHFGAILGDHYLDPQILIDESVPDRRPRLVPPGS